MKTAATDSGCNSANRRNVGGSESDQVIGVRDFGRFAADPDDVKLQFSGAMSQSISK